MEILSLECHYNVVVMSQHCCYVFPLCAMSWQCCNIAMMLLMLGVYVMTLNFGVLSPSVNVVADVVTLHFEITSV